MEMFTILAQEMPVATDRWADTFFGLDQGQRFTLLMIVIGCATGIVLGLAGIVSSTINAVHRRRIEDGMKRDMIERGMTADEIAKIIESAPPPEDATERWIASWGKKRKIS